MKLLVLDGNSILNRAFYGIKLLTAKDGTPTNALFGFLNILHKLENDNQPDAVAIAFDLKGPTFRHQMYDGYKAARKGMPEDLAVQLPLLKELLTDLGYPIVTAEGYEADDILGTLARACAERGDDCVLATGDRDSFQLIGNGTLVQLATTNPVKGEEWYDEARIQEKYGVTPRQLIDVKALMGDQSDNIPGVPGIGEKTALGLIARFGSLEGVYAHLDDPFVRPAQRQKLEAGRALADLSRKLAEIDTHAPVGTAPETYRRGPGDPAAAYRLLARLELVRSIKMLGLEPPETETDETPEDRPPAPAWTAAVTPEELTAHGRTLDLVLGEGVVAGWCDPDAHKVYTASAEPGWNDPAALFGAERLRSNDSKQLARMAADHGYPQPNVVMDTTLAAYLLNPTGTDYSLPTLFTRYGVAPALEEQPAGRMQQFARLCDQFAAEIEQNGQTTLLRDIELPLAAVLADMERLGFAVDREGIRRFGDGLTGQITALTAQIYDYAGETFNLNSPKQLGEVLFDKLGLPSKKKTKTGYSTNVDVLEALRPEHPIVSAILEYRQLSKLKSTYVDGLTKEIEPDGRIHSVFNQTETRTGRISSTEPNLQNIPVRTELGREMRRFFIAGPGCVLLDADYSQIELRVLASIAHDENMIAAFRDGVDIHTQTAAQVFGLPLDFVTPEMRSRAKAVNFGIVYGISAFSLSKDIGVSVAEADQYIKGYLRTFSGVRDYMDRTKAAAKEQGFVTTLFGRRRFLPELAASNANLRAFGERAAMNTPIQGTAADIIKIAMVRVHRRLAEQGLQARLILQVHDELIVEAPEAEADQAAAILQYEMVHAVDLAVPMSVDVHLGRDWYTAKG